MAGESPPKVEGHAAVELRGLIVDQVRPFLADFCNIHKWLPRVDTSHQLEGDLGQPGLIRYCASKYDGTNISWVKENLLMINPIERSLSYEILENNMGFKSYVSTIKVLAVNGDGQPGCKIEWSFVADPVEGWGLEDLISYVEYALQYMGQKMEIHSMIP